MGRMKYQFLLVFLLYAFRVSAQVSSAEAYNIVNKDVPQWFTHPAKGEYVGVSLPLETSQGNNQQLREKSAVYSAILSYLICMKKEEVKKEKSKALNGVDSLFNQFYPSHEYKLYQPEATEPVAAIGSLTNLSGTLLGQDSERMFTKLTGESVFSLQGDLQVVRKHTDNDGTVWVALRFNPNSNRTLLEGRASCIRETTDNDDNKVSKFMLYDPSTKSGAEIKYVVSNGKTTLSVEWAGTSVNGHYKKENIKNTAFNSKYLQALLGDKELSAIGYDIRGTSTVFGTTEPRGVGYLLSMLTLLEDNVFKDSMGESSDTGGLCNVGNYFESGYTQSYFMPSNMEEKLKYAVTPESRKANNNTFAVIFGNENYQQAEDVPYAQNDAKAFAEYCQRMLNVPEKQISVYENATYGNMRTAMKRLKETVKAYQGDLNIVFYYAGHGFPDEESQNAYLLPVDADGTIPEVCYGVNQLYAELGSMNARQIVVFMDACFSGSKRGDGMLQSARGIAIKAKPSELQGNMVVFSAATGEQTAYPYRSKEHGLFTYYLLSKLQMDNGGMTLGALADYVKKEVSKTSIVENKKVQTPTVTYSSSIKDKWKELKLK